MPMAPAGPPLDVLMVAYACSPARGGEHLLGWEWARRLGQRHRVTVLTQAARLHESDASRPDGLTMVGIDDARFRGLKRLGEPGRYAYYWCWQAAAAGYGRELLRQRHFDVVHQTTFHTYRIPGLLAAPENPPFVWGPIAGLERIPRPMLAMLGTGALKELPRAVANAAMPWLPSVRRTLRNAFAVLVSNPDTGDALAAVHRRDYIELPANAVELPELPPYDAEGEVLELIAVGEMVRFRAFELVLDAIGGLDAELRKRIRIKFIGAGADEQRLKRRLHGAAHADRVEFLGRLPRQVVLTAMRKAHLLVFPSLRDSGGSAVAEAMAMGLPVLAFPVAGPKLMLAKGGGFLIAPSGRRRAERDIRELLARLVRDRAPLARESARAIAAAAELFGWDGRIAAVEAIYRRAAGTGEARAAARAAAG